MSQLNRYYLFLLIVFGLIGPLLPTLPLWPTALFPIFGVVGGAEVITELLPEVLPFAYKVGILPALLTGALIWLLRLRRNRWGMGATFWLGGLLGVLALVVFYHLDHEHFYLPLLPFSFGGFSAYLLSLALPLPADKAIDPAREGHYFLLFLALPLLGPVLALLPVVLEISLIHAQPKFAHLGAGLKNLLGLAYLLGMAPAAWLGALVWVKGLGRNGAGCLKMVLLGFLIMMAGPGLIFSAFIFNGDISPALRLGAYGAFSALCFCPFLPRPEAAS